MALYFECRINKDTLLQTVFLVILPTGTAENTPIIELHLYSFSKYNLYLKLFSTVLVEVQGEHCCMVLQFLLLCPNL